MSAPFGASVAGVRSLVLTAATPADSGGIQPVGGTRPSRVSDDTINGWLESGGNRVLIRIGGYEALPPTLVDQIETDAQGLTELYAASLLADVTHPERAGGSGRLGDVLLARFQSGLNELAAIVASEVELLDPPEDPIVGYTDFGAAGRFRRPFGWLVRGF